MPKPQLITVAELAKILGVSKRTIHRRADSGQLPVYSRDTTGLHFDRAKVVPAELSAGAANVRA